MGIAMSRLIKPLVLFPVLAALALGNTQIYAADSSEVEKCLSLPDCTIMDGESGGREESQDESAESDWEPYAKKMLRKIRRNWIPPDAARKGRAGQAKIRFYIEPGGELACVEIKEFEGPPEFAAAAQAAVCKSTPFKPFPTASGSSSPEGVTITFFYNMKDHGSGFSFGISPKE
jgi:TonB family protein